MVEALLRLGSHTEVAMEDGSTPLFIATWHGHLSVVRALLPNRAQINRPTDTGTAPLFAAAMLGHVGIADELLRYAARVDQATDDGVTPLMAAASTGHSAVARCLLHFKADPTRMSNDGKTALSVASRRGHTGVRELVCSVLVFRSLTRIAAAACMKPWRSPSCPFDLPVVLAAERTLLVELASAAHRGGRCCAIACAVDNTHLDPCEEDYTRAAGTSASLAIPRIVEEQTRITPLAVAAPYLRLADMLIELDPAVAYYCRVFASGILLAAMRRGLWTSSAETVLVSVLEEAEHEKRALHLGFGREKLEAFVLIFFRRAERRTVGAETDSGDTCSDVNARLAARLWRDVVLLIDVLEWCHGGHLPTDWIVFGQCAREMAVLHYAGGDGLGVHSPTRQDMLAVSRRLALTTGRLTNVLIGAVTETLARDAVEHTQSRPSD
eukprot:TRINITY_DN74391_c0_g1_i1.p1 TRINITY_DN74391_c0_g1~~TRINITY_DN74391_c0_g1_i1.p1  ORF type:complete len:506 (-),score=65.60 TRINITY_DN74391_c0_g1_i1:10-1326(-)